ncbi:MAG: SIS domain-containing protein [Candidatus Aenigmatarchaeota archaeon]|nr:SIS domain-containing protein [Candidatus Aenigmarchaeota archaeon]
MYEDIIKTLIEVLYEVYKENRTIYAIGNGGSLGDASHFACDAISLGRGYEILPIRVIPLSDPTILSALANDYGFESVYERWLKAWAIKGDVVIVFTTSGESENIVRALEWAQKNGLITIGILGRNGGRAQQYCDYCIKAEGTTTQEIQDEHRKIYHQILTMLHERVRSQSKL